MKFTTFIEEPKSVDLKMLVSILLSSLYSMNICFHVTCQEEKYLFYNNVLKYLIMKSIAKHMYKSLFNECKHISAYI